MTDDRLLAHRLPLSRGASALHRQIYLGLRSLVAEGALPPGAILPSGRTLAADLAVSRNTVVAAYDQLASEGYLEIRERRRPRVADLGSGAPARIDAAGVTLSDRGAGMMAAPRQRALPGRPAFHPGTPDLTVFRFADWRRLMNRHLGGPRSPVFGYHHLSGHPPLKAAVARYLAVARGVRCRPEEILVTTGAQAALDLVARLLTDPGDTALRIGFLVLPGDLAARAAQAINVTGQYPPLLLQATLADFIEEGHFARHVNRTRRLYARRREAFVAAAREALEGVASYSPCDAGMQTLWLLEDGLDDVAIAATAERRAIVVGALSRHYRCGRGRRGLILGYTGTTDAEAAAALAGLREVIAAVGR
jgi:DNA-binding transcriptional MocR family regulator